MGKSNTYQLKDTSTYVAHAKRSARAVERAATWAEREHPTCLVFAISSSFDEVSREWEAFVTISHLAGCGREGD